MKLKLSTSHLIQAKPEATFPSATKRCRCNITTITLNFLKNQFFIHHHCQNYKLSCWRPVLDTMNKTILFGGHPDNSLNWYSSFRIWFCNS